MPSSRRPNCPSACRLKITFNTTPQIPKALPEENGVQLVVGQVAGIAVDERNGHVWIVQRPASLLADEWAPKTNKPVTHRCCKSLPPVAEFDTAGNYVRGWAPQGNVRLVGNGNEDNQILKFSPDGKFLMQIGRAGKSEGSNSCTQLGRPAHMVMDAAANELYIEVQTLANDRQGNLFTSEGGFPIPS